MSNIIFFHQFQDKRSNRIDEAFTKIKQNRIDEASKYFNKNKQDRKITLADEVQRKQPYHTLKKPLSNLIIFQNYNISKQLQQSFDRKNQMLSAILHRLDNIGKDNK